MPQDDEANDRSGLRALIANSSSADIRKYYDDWAGKYDEDLVAWNYQAPTIAANLLKRGVSTDAAILDVGCGTGLSGVALQTAGFREVTGVDISQSSLELAGETGAYGRLNQVDLHELPLPYGADEFGGLQCVGVLSYVPDTDAILREFCRLVKPDGLVVFSQRDDIYLDRDYEAVLRDLENDGACVLVSVSDPAPYLPENEEFGEMIKVVYAVLQVR